MKDYGIKFEADAEDPEDRFNREIDTVRNALLCIVGVCGLLLFLVVWASVNAPGAK